MRPARGGSESEHRNEREWILRCEGFQVFGPDGELLGTVTAVVYEHSARWDAPHGLRVRSASGATVVAPLESIDGVDPAGSRISIRPNGVFGEDTPTGQ